MTDPAIQRGSVPRLQRLLLPRELLEEPDGRRSAREWVIDVSLFVVALGIGLLVLADSWAEHGDAERVVDIALGLVACASLWVRRRHPVAVGVAAVGLSAVSALAGGAGLVALFNSASRAPRRALNWIVVLAFASTAIFPLVYDIGNYESQVFFGVLVTIVVIGWGLFARARRELVYSLRERAERLESEQQLRVAQAREAERRRIAREMHDVLAHRISLLSVHAGALEFRPDASPEEVAEAASVIRASAHSALQELRDVIGVLRDDGEESTPQPPQPTIAELPALIEESRAAGMNVRWRDETAGAEAIPAALGRTAYRVVQEGLTNARKHAPDTAVEVTLDAGPPLVVEIVNRRALGGEGTDELAGTGTGLVALAERVALARGELEHGSNADGDFVLRASLPWTP